MSSKTKMNQLETSESAQLILQNATVLSELSSQLKRETKKGEDYLGSLQSLLSQASSNVASLHQCVDTLLAIAKKLVYQSLKIVPERDPNFQRLKTEADKLLNILNEIRPDVIEQSLDTKWKHIDRALKQNLSLKSINIDEKYPERISRESLLDINSLNLLPTLHEDIFVDFYKPSKSLSSISQKNLRKVQKFLMKVDDDDEGIADEAEARRPSLFQQPIEAGSEHLIANNNVGCPPTVSTGTDPFPELDHIKD